MDERAFPFHELLFSKRDNYQMILKPLVLSESHYKTQNTSAMKNTRKILALAVFTFFFLACADKDTFVEFGEEEISLNGNWHFKTDPDSTGTDKGWHETGLDVSGWDKLPVPGNWDVENDYAHYIGKAFYRRSFEAPEKWQDSQVYLKFEAVYETADVWLNGNYLGKHIGGYTPFEFNVSDKLHYDSENTLVVRADNTYNRGAWWQWGGISRDVSLVRHNDVRIVYTLLQAEPDFENDKVDFTIKYIIENQSSKDVNLELAARILNAGDKKRVKNIEHLTGSGLIEAGKSGYIEVAKTFDLNDFSLWHFDDPNLYQLESSIKEANQFFHKTLTRFGIRKLEARGTKLYFNNEPVRLNGFNRIHDHRVYGNTEPEALVKADIDNMKRLGGVFSRIMHAPQAKSLLDYCDEVGYLIIEEIPVWGIDDPQAFPDNPLTKQWLKEMIYRGFNHPSIVGWSVSNEVATRYREEPGHVVMTEDHYHFTKTMLQYIKNDLDSSRLNIYVSFSAFRANATPENEPMEFSDIININIYGNPARSSAVVHERWPDKPIFISEYGRTQVGLDPNTGSLHPGVLSFIDSLRTLDYVVGTALWTYNDYRSRYVGTPASENRGWGVYNVWRQPKRAAAQIQKEYAPIRNLTLEKEGEKLSMLIEPRHNSDIPSYILRNYLLKLIMVSKDNTTNLLFSEVIKEIKPGDAPFRFEHHLGSVSEKDAYLMASLVTPTGIDVYTTKIYLFKPEMPAIKDIIPGNNSVRVVVDHSAATDAYKVYYGQDELSYSTEETINNFIDIKELASNQEYNFALVAINGKGESEKSELFITQTNDLLLPPIIWNIVPVGNSFVVGYSVEDTDQTFEIKYGTEPGVYETHLKEITLKGSYKISGLEKNKTYFLRMKRNTEQGTSSWSDEQSTPR